jgi:polysaccharide biosynthesis transport protein
MTVIFRSLWAKLGVSALVAAIVILIGWVIPLTPPAFFDVAARIWIQSKTPTADTGDSHSSSNLFQSFMTYFNSPILTACEVLKSTLILEEAIKDLKKELPADKVPSLADLKNGVKVEPVSDTDILIVRYRDTDALVGTSVIQAILDAFLRLQISQTTYSAQQSKTFLQSQLEDEKKELKRIDGEIKEYQVANHLLDIPSQVGDLLKRQEGSEEALRTAEARRQEAKQRVAFLEGHLGVNADDALAVGEMANDPIFAQTKKKLAELEFEYSELGTNYRPEHPRMRQLQALIEQLKEACRQRLTAILGDAGVHGGAAHNSALSRVSPDMMKEMVAARAEETAQEHLIANLQNNLSEVGQQVSKLPEKELTLADLLRAQKVIFDRISMIEGNLSSARLIEAVNKHSPSFQIIDRPQVINVTVSSKKPKFLTAVILGLFLGIGTFFLLDWMDPRLRRISTVMNNLPLPVVGWLGHLPVDLSRNSLESIHRIRLGLKPWLVDDKGQFVVTSADIGDGKTTISAGLALSFSLSGASVLLVDADFVDPSIHRLFKNLPASPGLSDYLASPGKDLWPEIVQSVGKNLKVIPAGSQSKADNLLLTSDQVNRFLDQAKREADVVIFDTPAATNSAASLALLGHDVNLLVVVRLNHTHQPALRLLATQLKQHEYGSSGILLVNVEDDAVAIALAKGDQQEELEPA